MPPRTNQVAIRIHGKTDSYTVYNLQYEETNKKLGHMIQQSLPEAHYQ